MSTSSVPRWLFLAVPVAALIVLAILVLLLFNHPSKDSPLSAQVDQPVPASYLASLQAIAQSSLQSTPTPEPSPLTPISGPSLTQDGKPVILYIGADFCPFCASLRWPLTLALLRFGTFQGLRYMLSSATDVYANTPTFSYYQARYTSPYLAFQAVETETRKETPLQSPTPVQQQIFTQFNSSGSIPFLYIDGRYLQIGDNRKGLLTAESWDQVLKTLQDPQSPLYQSVIFRANVYTAAFCLLTGGQPSSVCQAPGVLAASRLLPGA
jgi:thiol-disulfide isomerase/thioredoxin